jgi:endonuclease/exonuclease/phosphatase family metal-dependent hydrolase
LIEQIKRQDPDVLGLNEVDLGALKTSFIDIGSYFAHKLNMYYFYGYTFYKHYGNVLLSKYPILNAEIIKLPLNVSSAEPRSMIKANLEINSSLWTVYVTHLSTKKDDRIEQVKAIVNEMNESTFEKIVWMGDFNFEPTDLEYSLINSTISSLNFTDTYSKLNTDPGYTGHFDDEFEPQKRIDYIMCSTDLTPLESEVYCSEASDHCAVITQF